MQPNKGVLVILSGPSGAGKSTVISGLTARRGDIRFSVSATTRDPRPGEKDGREYFFKTREEFFSMLEQDAFLEHAEYVGNCYGTPAAPVEENLAAGYNVLLDIEVQGAAQVMAHRPDAVSIFLCPPSLEELENRLHKRGTDPEERIQARIAAAREEYTQLHNYAYIVVNDDADTAVRELDAIITAELCRGERRLKTIFEGENLL
ncbi:MAG: guanylate kinase [Oscillospiraceae bacterium]|nr:guanylate kinase [Oscillospiraceae bacterium]